MSRDCNVRAQFEQFFPERVSGRLICRCVIYALEPSEQERAFAGKLIGKFLDLPPQRKVLWVSPGIMNRQL